jgi:5-methyltetrahydropteroyltriglutamate--homocysteine methyltransferase
MKRSTDRIITSHVGSLVRPPEVVAMLRERPAGKLFEGDELTTLQKAIDDAVALQKETGIDVPNDGEFPKSGFANYITDRLTGFEEIEGSQAGFLLGRDRKKFLEAYAEMEGPVPGTGRGLAAGVGRSQTALTCTGPITFVGQKFVEQDIANMKASMARHGYDEAFYPATAPGTIELQRPNQYYKTNEEYLEAIANAMHEEYKLITDAGFVLQIDDPRGVTAWDSMDPPPAPEEYAKFAQIRVDALNYALQGIPEELVRYHVCWGSWHGPHTTDIEFKHIVNVTLQIKAQCYSVEAANPRHAHEYHVFEDVKLPEGKILMPGVIAHTTNCVEHPELVAERIMNYAKLVGRENVIAGPDCGFAQGFATKRVHESIQWEKFRVMREGADIATKRLWK